MDIEDIFGFVGVCLAVLLFAIGCGLLFALPFMWIWNYAVVSALNIANPIDYWVSFWLMLFTGYYMKSSNITSSTD